MGLSNEVIGLDVPLGVEAGDAQDIGPNTLDGAVLIVSGTFVATLRIECSVDGTVWFTPRDPGGVNAIPNFTGAGAAVLAGDAVKVRANVIAYTSGTPVVKLMKNLPFMRADRQVN